MNRHENIDHPDAHQYDRESLEFDKLVAERDFYRRRYEAVCNDLRAIYERVEAGEPVYFVRRGDESRLFLKAAKETPAKEPGE